MTRQDIEPITGLEAHIARAAVTRQREQMERWTEVSSILNLGHRSRMIEMFEVGDRDAIVQVTFHDGEYWGAVVDNERPRQYVNTRDEALLQLVAVRYDGPNTQAHRYAARVLGCPTTE